MPNSPSPYHPTPRDLIQLNLPTDVKVSPKGTYVAINVRMTNWAEDRYETVCKLYNCDTQETHTLTRTGNVQQVEWLDEQTVGVLKTTNGEEKAQVYLYEGLTGDGWAVTAHEDGVHWFAPFADGLLYLANRPDDETAKQREAEFGHYTNFEQETSMTALYYVGPAELRVYEEQLWKSTPEEAKLLVRPVVELSKLLPNPVSIRRVIPCPTGKAIYLNCWTRDDLVYDHTVHSYRISLDAPMALIEQIRREQDNAANGGPKEVTTAQKEIAYLGELTRLSLPAGAYLSAVSPDGTRLLVAYQERDRRMFTRSDLWLLETDEATSVHDARHMLKAMQNISATLDRDLLSIQWIETGIFAGYVDGCVIRTAHFAEDGTVTPLDFQATYLTHTFHVNASGAIGLIGANRTQIPEVYLARQMAATKEWTLTQLTDFGAAVADWQFGTVETVRWFSIDGTEIEGVLRNFTNDYLSGSPFKNREHYSPTAPMSNIANAKTPMLIQHGSEDKRVPFSNAMELYRGLQAMQVPVELFVYPGMGHPITKPRENHAVMCQNLSWFGHYLLGWQMAL